MRYIGTIKMEDWPEDAVTRIFNGLDLHELYLGREIGKGGYRHYQFCCDCAGDLEQYAIDNSLKWHIEKCVSWEDSKNYCRKTGNYLYLGNSREERYYRWVTSRRPLSLWMGIITTVASQNDREIDVWIDTIGGQGKSTLCYLLERRGKCLSIPRTELNATRLIDFVAMHHDNEPIIVVDIPRDLKVTKELCRALEDIKDGVITSAKYQGTKKFIKGTKLIVFTNHYIEEKTYTALTEDRWRTYSVKKWYEFHQGNT